MTPRREKLRRRAERRERTTRKTKQRLELFVLRRRCESCGRMRYRLQHREYSPFNGWIVCHNEKCREFYGRKRRS